MKIQVLNRSLDDHLPPVIGAPAPKRRNLDPALHPFAKPREYQRALNAAKLDRMFAKPFVGAIEGHSDGIYALQRDPVRLSVVGTGGGDGEVRVWSLGTRSTLFNLPKAHTGMVKDICFAPTFQSGTSAEGSSSRMAMDAEEDEAEAEARTPSRLLSCGVDKTVKLWDARGHSDKPLQTYTGKHGFNSITHHRTASTFATASDRISVWDVSRTSPLVTLSYNPQRASSSLKDNYSGEHIQCVRFHQSETNILASSGSDRSVVLYDLRSEKALGRVIMQMRVNMLSFNPLQPPILLMGSEDHNLYTFDMRNFSSATQVYKDHVGAVMTCDWSPTGREFVSGSYDRTLRLWSAGQGKSHDTYHTKRMQRVFTAQYTLDTRYVLSGSDDGNLRIWKSRASDKLGVSTGREMAAREYRDTLREKWGETGEVRKIDRQRYLPKAIHNAQKLKRTMLESRRKKEENRRANTKKGSQPDKPKAERKKGVLAVQS